MKKSKKQFEPRFVKVAGTKHSLRVFSVTANCGGIRGGIGFEFGNQGAWVVDFHDLKQLIAEAEALR